MILFICCDGRTPPEMEVCMKMNDMIELTIKIIEVIISIASLILFAIKMR